MKKIHINKINENIFYEKLENGLEIFFYIKDTVSNVYATLTTKYGSINKEFIPIDSKKIVTMPDGIAHFLEHKIFAQESGEDVSSFFEKSGASYNAHTSLKSTTYEVTGPNNVINNILFLLDYVQSPYFTDENVEIEKGIIKEEINMCNDNPWNILYDKIRYNLFTNDPIRYSISGTLTDIDKINKKLLYTCYNTFYHPSNMFLVVTGNFDKDKLLEEIKKNQDKKKFPNINIIKNKEYKEPKEVYKKEEIVKINTHIPKFSYSIKLPLEKVKNISKRKAMLYLYILFNMLFDETSLLNLKLKEEGIITNNTNIDILESDKYIIISLINETQKYEILKQKIKETLNNIIIDEQTFKRKKKVLISNELFGYENITIVNEIITDSILLDNKVEDNIIGIIESLNIEEFKTLIDSLDFNNNSIVILKN